MSPDKLDQMEDTGSGELRAVIDRLLSRAQAELKGARGDVEATKVALFRYYQQGIEAKLTPEKLDEDLYDLLGRVRYSPDQMFRISSIIDGLHSINFGMPIPETAPADDDAAAGPSRSSGGPVSQADTRASVQVAKDFGDLLARGDYGTAHALLTSEARALYSAKKLKRALKTMTAYAPGPIRQVEVMEDFVLEDWPDKKEGDLAWVYVSLVGDDYAEAVSLVLAKELEAVRIRHLEWGRP